MKIGLLLSAFMICTSSALAQETDIAAQMQAARIEVQKYLPIGAQKLTREIPVAELMEVLKKYEFEAGALNLGGMDSGGGDSVAQEFMGIAHDVADYLEMKALPGVVASTFKDQLESLRIFTVPALYREGNELDAVNIPKFKTILLSRARWNAQRDNIKRERLVLHEILGVMELEDANYQISYKYKSEAATVYNGRAFKLFKPISNSFYGVAFGIKNQMVDFELIEREGRASDFLIDRADQGLLCNYIVDVLNNKILAGHDNCGDLVDANLGEMHYGNHYSYDLTVGKVSVEPMDWSSEYALLIETSSMKWFGGINSFMVAKRTYGDTQVVAKCEGACLENFHQEIMARLSVQEQALLEELGANYFEISSIELPDYSEAIKIEETYYRPKSDDTQELKVITTLRAKLLDTKLKLEILDVTAQVVPADF